MTDRGKLFEDLIDIMAALRSENGCPWDKEQTRESIKPYLIEEVYEVITAIDSKDVDAIKEELGDVLFQVIFHSRIGEENKEFTIKDVLEGIKEKIVGRHPHVFGSENFKDSAEVLVNWEELKKEERDADASMLDSVPKQLPALSYSQDIQSRVTRVGFDWENIEGVIDKLVEEVNEFKQTDSQERRAQEFGDLLFTLVNIARRLGVDSESALREANKRFYRRFSCMEELCRQRGLDFADLSFDAQNALWEEAKEKVK